MKGHIGGRDYVSGIIRIIDHSKSYRKDSARQRWLDRLVEFEDQPIDDFVASVTANPPSTPESGVLEDQLEPPQGWISFFEREGILSGASTGSSLSEAFSRVILGWQDYKAKIRTDKTAAVYVEVTSDIPRIIQSRLSLSPSRFKVKGSTGVGNITAAPWIAIFETSVTNSATTGFYPVYLLSTDLQRLYLIIGFGANQFTETFGISDGRKKIRQAVKKVQPLFVDRLPAQRMLDGIDLQSEGSKLHKGYEDGSIYCWKNYDTTDLPSGSVLIDDLKTAVEFYEMMIADPLMPSLEDLVVSAAPVSPPEIEAVVEQVEFAPRVKKKKSSSSSSSGGGKKRYSRQSQKVGLAGEEIVLLAEIEKLEAAGRPDLAKNIIPHYKVGETPGWDITSFDSSGNKIYIEVKSTVSKTMSSLELTRNEWRAAQKPENRNKYCLYLVIGVFSKKLKIVKMNNPAEWIEENGLSIEPSIYELSLTVEES
jgi:hypothetical protein